MNSNSANRGRHGRIEDATPDRDDFSLREEVPTDVAEKPGSSQVSHDHADELVDEWGEESFPGSDPPAHY